MKSLRRIAALVLLAAAVSQLPGCAGGQGPVTGAAPSRSFTATSSITVSDVSVAFVTSASAMISWNTNGPATTQVDYGLTTSYGFSAGAASLASNHSQSLSGLTARTLYHFRIHSKDSNGNDVTSGDSTFSTGSPTTTVPGITITNVATSSITAGSVVITWTTSAPATSQVEYGTSTTYGSTSAVDTVAVSSHSVILIGLLPGTLYHFRVHSSGSTGGDVVSDDATFTTLANLRAVQTISNIGVVALSSDTVDITWTTSLDATSQVEYGLSASYGALSPLDSTLVTNHLVALTGLLPGTMYHARVRSRDATSTTDTTSQDFTFTTTTPVLLLSNVGVFSVNTDSATVTWMTSSGASSQVDYGTTLAYGFSTPFDGTPTTTHSQTLTGLVPGTLYHFRVRSQDTNGVVATSADGQFSTVSGSTTLNISGVFLSSVGASSATIGWTTGVTANSQIQFGTTAAYGSSTVLDPNLVTAHAQTISGLLPSTVYHFSVVSTDSGGNLVQSDDFTFTTAGTILSFAAVAANPIGTTSATIGWTTSLPATSEVEYGPTSSYGFLSALDPNLVVTHSVGLTGLTPGTLYHFRLRSATASTGEVVSADFTFTTALRSSLLISNVAVTGVAANGATLTWTTDQPATSQVNYGTTIAYGSSTPLDSNLVLSHSVVLIGLNAGTLYHAQPLSGATAGIADFAGPDTTFTTTAAPPPPPTLTISNVQSSSVGTTSVTISWTTSEPATGLVEYGLTAAYGTSTAIDLNLSTTHSQVLTGLNPGIQYHYRVHSSTVTSGDVVSGDFTFITSNASRPAGIRYNVGWTSLGSQVQLSQTPSICPVDTVYNSIQRVQGCSAVVTNWGGGILRTASDQLLMTGGGHSGYGGNELYSVNLSLIPVTLTRFNGPTLPGTGGPIVLGVSGCGGGDLPSGVPTLGQGINNGVVALPPVFNVMDLGTGPTNICTDCVTDPTGHNCAADSKHNYSQLVYIPPNAISCSTDPNMTGDMLFEYSGFSAWGTSNQRKDAWVYHFGSYSGSTRWQRLDTWATYFNGYKPNSGFGFSAEWDPQTQKIYLYDGDYVFSWELCSNTVTRLSSAFHKDTRNTGVIDPVNHLLVIFNINSGVREIYHYDITANTITNVTSTVLANGCSLLTDNNVTGQFNWQWLGAAYDPDLKKVVTWPDFGNTIYDYDPATKSCTKTTYGGDLVGNSCHSGSACPNSNGTFGRFRYVPDQKIYILVNDWNLPAMVLCRQSGGC